MKSALIVGIVIVVATLVGLSYAEPAPTNPPRQDSLPPELALEIVGRLQSLETKITAIESCNCASDLYESAAPIPTAAYTEDTVCVDGSCSTMTTASSSAGPILSRRPVRGILRRFGSRIFRCR